ncbi:MAG: glycosyltransferase [Cyclobacteriaceae bacterium]
MSAPLVSVLLPVYNAEKTIKRAVKSILQQTYSNFELLIVNNGSSDNTESAVASLIDDRIKHYHLPEANLVKALNFAITKSSGKYLARMDADDYSYSNRFELQVNYLGDNPKVGLVSGLVEYVGDQDKNQGYNLYVDWANSKVSEKEIYLSRFQESALPHPSVMFRKSIITENGLYKEGPFPEDFELWNRLLFAGVRMAKVNKTILDWYDDENRLSRKHPSYSIESFSRIKAEYFSYWFFKKFSQNQPHIFIWGTGSSVRKKSSLLKEYGMKIDKYIDVAQSSSPSIIHYKELKLSDDIFILSYVSDRIGKEEIYQYLIDLGYTEGVNFYMME